MAEKEAILITVIRWIIVFGIIISVSLWLIDQTIVVISPTEVGVIYDARSGLLKETMPSGWHFKIPVLQTIYKVPIARDTINCYGTFDECQKDPNCDDMIISVPSKEGLEIGVDVSIFYKIRPEKAIDIIQKLTINYVEGTIIPSVRSSTRDVAGGMAVTELYGAGREKLEQGIFERMQLKMEADGFILEEVLIRDVRIPDQIKVAIEEKQKTEQEFLQKEFELKKEEIEAQRKIVEAKGIAESNLLRAEAEAKAIEIQGKALRENPDVVTLRAIEKWDGILPKITSGAIPFLNIPFSD